MYTLERIKSIETNYTLPDHVLEVLDALLMKIGGNPLAVSSNKESLKGLLNKLTADTYNAISAKILKSKPSLETVDDIFKTAHANMFYSKLYARLCLQMAPHAEIQQRIVEKSEAYVKDVANVTAEDRGATLFVCNLGLNGTIPMQLCTAMAKALQNAVEGNLDGDEEKTFVYVDHLALVLTQNKAFTDECALGPSIQKMLDLDTKRHKGISLKIIFKYMDIIDHFK